MPSYGTVVDPSGVDYSQATVSWQPVTQADDGSDLDVSMYQVMVSYDSGATWSQITSTAGDTTTATLPNILNGSNVQVAVRALGTNNVLSDQSAPLTLVLSPDTTPPPVPTPPTVVSSRGALLVNWDGAFAAGAAKPADFVAVRVYRSTGTVTAIGANLVGTFGAKGTLVTTGAYTVAQNFIFTSIDVRGNESAPTAVVSGTATPLVSSDIGSVDGVTIVDGSIVGADKIAARTISALQIKTNELTADVIKAGTIDTLQLKATAIDGMTITGALLQTSAAGSGSARVAFDATGFYQYNSSGAVVSQWTPTLIQIVGVFKTGSTGPRVEMGSVGVTDSYGNPASVGGLTFYSPDSNTTQPQILHRTDDMGSSGARAVGHGFVLDTGKRSSSSQGQLRFGDDTGQGTPALSVDSFSAAGTLRTSPLMYISDHLDVGSQISTRGGLLLQASYLRSGGDVRIILGADQSTIGSPTNVAQYFAAKHSMIIGSTERGYWDANGLNVASLYFHPQGNVTITEAIQSSATGLKYGSRANHDFFTGTTQLATLNASGLTLQTIGTTTSAANLNINGSGLVQQFSSLSKFKLDQQEIPLDYRVLDLRPKTWVDRGHHEATGSVIRTAGFVAEELKATSDTHDGAFEPLVTYEQDEETLKAVDRDAAALWLFPIVRDIARRLDELERPS